MGSSAVGVCAIAEAGPSALLSLLDFRSVLPSEGQPEKREEEVGKALPRLGKPDPERQPSNEGVVGVDGAQGFAHPRPDL